jgi:uncharacterized membrane protein HdeD (DUF308 family)
MPDTQGKSIWLTLEGGLLVLLGVLALISPLFAGLAVAVVFGWVLLMVGVLGLVAAFAGRAHAHRGWSIASAAAALIAGLILVFNPIVGAVGLTILLGAYLFVDGVTMIGFSFDQRKRGARAWTWTLAGGLLDLILAAVILPLGGAGSAVLVGVVIGLDLIVAGIALLVLHRMSGRSPAGLVDSGTSRP